MDNSRKFAGAQGKRLRSGHQRMREQNLCDGFPIVLDDENGS